MKAIRHSNSSFCFTPFTLSERNITLIRNTIGDRKRNVYEGTPVIPATVQPELTMELNATLEDKLDEAIGKGLYHDLTASVLAAPMTTEEVRN